MLGGRDIYCYVFSDCGHISTEQVLACDFSAGAHRPHEYLKLNSTAVAAVPLIDGKAFPALQTRFYRPNSDKYICIFLAKKRDSSVRKTNKAILT